MQTIPWWRRFDPLLVALPLALIIYGLAMIHSATCQPNCGQFWPLSSETMRQALFAAIGFAAMAIFALLDYRLSRWLAYLGYLGALGLLGLVLVIGHDGADYSYGAHRWISFGPFNVQPSELAKLALILALARLLSGANGNLSWRRLAVSLVMVAPALVLVFKEPDLGTTLSLVAIWFAMLCGAGLRLSQLGLLVGTGLAAIPLSWLILQEYMRERVLTFVRIQLDPTYDQFGEGYNIAQAKISIGSGGMWGRGLMQGTQVQLDYLRVSHSDFIFSVLAEEVGFIGGMLLFGLMIVLLMRILRVADRSRDDYGRLIAFGIGAWLLFQVFVNLGSNLTLLPVTGVPLPFLSVGGSSLVTLLLSLGILQSVLLRRMKFRY